MKRFALASITVLACDGAPAPAPAVEEKAIPAKPKAPELPPAPDGSVLIAGTYVHTCAAADACPSLLQPAGAAHCGTLTLGGFTWRLPTREEIAAWRGNKQLAVAEGFHWSSTSFDDDPKQLWIHDPSTGTETTIPSDRKPFRVRCVARP